MHNVEMTWKKGDEREVKERCKKRKKRKDE